eukprot:Platyproteum_vivax@DN5755_c0_g1_i2.p1
MATDLYAVWRSPQGDDCFRLGAGAKCFCGHKFEQHVFHGKRDLLPKCNECKCKGYRFVPQRPEEVGEWWLPRRKEFNIHTYRAKCKCKHTHEEHECNPPFYCKKCGCGAFNSAFLCIGCDKHWEDHETIFETGQERKQAGRPIGVDFIPFSELPDFQEAVYNSKVPPGADRLLRPKHGMHIGSNTPIKGFPKPKALKPPAPKKLTDASTSSGAKKALPKKAAPKPKAVPPRR